MFDLASTLSMARSAAGTVVSAVNAFSSATAITGLIGAGNSIAGILAQASGGIGGLRFPLDLASHGNWVSFTPQATTGVGSQGLGELISTFTSSALSQSVGGSSVSLPLPSNLSVDYNPNYESKDLGSAVGQVIKTAEKGMYTGGAQQNATELAKKIGSKAGEIAGGIALKAVSNLAGNDNLGAALKVLGGVAVNPHKILLFTGVDFRDHQFSWKLSPKNRTESNAIQSIIQSFVRSSHPDFAGGGLFLTYPDYFNISIQRDQYLYKFIPCVCTDVKVNYHGQGFPAYIIPDNGGQPAPVEVELSLSFKEIEIVTRNSVAAGGTGFGF